MLSPGNRSGAHTQNANMQEVVSIGAGPKADMQVSGSNVAEQHAEIFQKYDRTYCKALAGDEQDVTSSSYTWLDDSESSLRTGKLLTAMGICSAVV